jgi:GNAT superfamily N-acetyltransferase
MNDDKDRDKNGGRDCGGLSTPKDVFIDTYRSEYLEAIRDICFRTGFAGESLEEIVDNKDLFVDLDINYFISEWMSEAIVAKVNDKVAGYLFIAPDEKNYIKYKSRYFTKRIFEAVIRIWQFSRRDVSYYSQYILASLRGEFKNPVFYEEYPSLLHINVAPECQSHGVGTKLFAAMDALLARIESPGVHLVTTSLNYKALNFYDVHGFRELYRKKAAFYRKWVKEDVFYIVLGKKL